MERQELLARISIDPNVCFGKPCIKGRRIWVSLILDYLASGWAAADVLREFPGWKRRTCWPASRMGPRWRANVMWIFPWAPALETEAR